MDASVGIAKKLKIPTTIIGATIVSIGTTIPELLVTIFSIVGHSSDISVGNAIGSVVFNTCINGGLLLTLSIIMIKKGFNLDYLLLIFALLLSFLMGIDGKFAIWESIILLSCFASFVIFCFLKAKKESKVTTQINLSDKNIFYYLIIFLVSATAIGVGAYFLIEKAKFLAKLAGLSEMFIGLTIVALGTSLPELITTINSLRKKESGLGLGNIVGSNIINATLFVGLTGAFNQNGFLNISKQTLLVSYPLAIISTIILLLPTIINKKSYKWQGVSLLILYVFYYVFLILSALNVIHI